MKKLSIEQKAKAYDEAIKVAREYWNSPRTCIDIDVLPELFPEIRELDDEEIRNGIIQYLEQSQFGEEHYQIDDDIVRDYIAWLEKQGEQKSIWHNEDEEPKRGSLILLIMQSGTPIVAKIIEPNHTFNHGERWAYIDDLLEKQVEPTDIPADAVLDGNKDGLIADTIRCKRENQEWSEEDEDMRDDIIRYLKRLSGDMVSPNQPYQKEIQWLKSLRPQSAWKPSNEQLYTLEKATHIVGSKYKSCLNSLYSELKKLREE